MIILMLIKDIKRLDGAADHDANIIVSDMNESWGRVYVQVS